MQILEKVNLHIKIVVEDTAEFWASSSVARFHLDGNLTDVLMREGIPPSKLDAYRCAPILQNGSAVGGIPLAPIAHRHDSVLPAPRWQPAKWNRPASPANIF